MTPESIVALGRRVIDLETEALAEVSRRLGPDFVRAVELITQARGRVIVSGVGKSGIIARKIAATLTSTGTPTTFLHPTESMHGDLGIVGSEDVAILLSKSGDSEEILTLLAHLKRFGTSTIAITGNPASALARECDAVLDAWVREEACPHDLAPTTSTTAALALGDALAVVILDQKGFRREDFARIHPGGSLGRKLLMRVRELMEVQDLPLVREDAPLRTALMRLAKRRGIVVVVDDPGRVVGVFTAGDLSRHMERVADPFAGTIGEVMTRSPQVAQHEELASSVVYRMEQIGIMAMPVIDEAGRVVGIVHLHDLMRAGVA